MLWAHSPRGMSQQGSMVAGRLGELEQQLRAQSKQGTREHTGNDTGLLTLKARYHTAPSAGDQVVKQLSLLGAGGGYSHTAPSARD